MKAKHFIIQELVDEETYLKRGEKCWELINPNLITLIDKIKDKFPKGSMYINNWKWGMGRDESGLRTAYSKNYSTTSQHSLGNAADFIFTDYDEAEVRKYLIDNKDEFPEMRGIEDFRGMSWVHVDVRNCDSLKVFTG